MHCLPGIRKPPSNYFCWHEAPPHFDFGKSTKKKLVGTHEKKNVHVYNPSSIFIFIFFSDRRTFKFL